MASPLTESLASFTGKLRTFANDGVTSAFVAEPQAAAAGAFDPNANEPTLAEIGVRTVNKNHVLYPARTGRETLTVRNLGGDIRYGYTDRNTLHQDGFLIKDGEVFEITVGKAVYVSVPNGANVEINYDENEG